MGKSCHVCLSSNRAIYDKLRMEGREVKLIWRLSKTDYKDNINLHSFYYHFQNHLENIIEEGVKASKFREKQIEKEIYQSIEAAMALRQNLVLSNKQLEMLKDKMDDPEVRKEIRDIMFKSNQTIELILRFIDKLQSRPKDSTENVFEKIIFCMKDFPPELILKFTERWKDYDLQRTENRVT